MIRHAVHFWQEYHRYDTICFFSHLNRWHKTITYSISDDADFDHFIRWCLIRLCNVVLLPFVINEFFLAGVGILWDYASSLYSTLCYKSLSPKLTVSCRRHRALSLIARVQGNRYSVTSAGWFGRRYGNSGERLETIMTPSGLVGPPPRPVLAESGAFTSMARAWPCIDTLFNTHNLF